MEDLLPGSGPQGHQERRFQNQGWAGVHTTCHRCQYLGRAGRRQKSGRCVQSQQGVELIGTIERIAMVSMHTTHCNRWAYPSPCSLRKAEKGNYTFLRSVFFFRGVYLSSLQPRVDESLCLLDLACSVFAIAPHWCLTTFCRQTIDKPSVLV